MMDSMWMGRSRDEADMNGQMDPITMGIGMIIGLMEVGCIAGLMGVDM